MTTVTDAPAATPRAPDRTTDEPTPPRGAAVRVALRHYFRELGRQRLLAAGATLLPALGNVANGYVPPLFVGALIGRLAGGNASMRCPTRI